MAPATVAGDRDEEEAVDDSVGRHLESFMSLTKGSSRKAALKPNESFSL